MRNDKSFLIDKPLNLYEHNSTQCPNLPLRGLLYFTDGKGIYPAKRPPYETAFVFVDTPGYGRNVPSSGGTAGTSPQQNAFGDDIPEVPPWAMRIHLDEDELGM